MSDKTIKFEIVTPERVVLKEEVMQVTVPTREGEITILPNHIPLVGMIKPGVIEVKMKSGEIGIISVAGGFVEVLKDKVVILADKAEHGHEIDVERAEAAKRKAEEIKKQAVHKEDVDFAALSSQIEKELARTRAAKRWRKIKGMDNK